MSADPQANRRSYPVDRVSLLSVEHTGTHTLHSVLNVVAVWHSREMVHNDPVRLKEMHDDLSSYTVVSPVREPREVWKSWAKRINCTPEEDEDFYEKRRILFVESWRAFQTLVNFYEPIIFPIEILTVKDGTFEGDLSVAEERVAKFPWHESMDEIYYLPSVNHFYSL